MADHDELRQQRNGLRNLSERVSRVLSDVDDCQEDLVGTIAAIPSGAAVGMCFAVKLVDITGPDGPPGSSPSLAESDFPQVSAICLGPGVPSAAGNPVLLSTSKEGRLVFVY